MDTQSPHKSDANVGMAALSYLGILVLIPLFTDARHDPFVKFHIKQGLVLLVVWVLGSVFFWIPIIGWLLWVCVLVLFIIGLMNALNKRQQELPIIGQFGHYFRF